MREERTEMPCPLIFACDESYAMPLATALRSIVESNQRWWPLQFIILTFSFSERTQEKVIDSLPTGSASISWIPVDLRLFDGFSTLDYISNVTYARFLIPSVVPETASKVLYLDADLLVLSDLAPLWETELGQAAVGAVRDRLDDQIKADMPCVAAVPRVREYFNAGVLLIDLANWRREKVSEKALEFLTQHPNTPFFDQDALNVACDGIWTKLDARWNFLDRVYEVDIASLSAEQRPWIVHFVTRRKPWNARIPNINASFYDAFRSRTQFSRTSLERQRDIWRGNWSTFKRVLKRVPAIRALWNQMMMSQP
jgi:lipopolysaccharide biosynthesis glycosyltransferase